MTISPVRKFALSAPGSPGGISCDVNGAFIDAVPLLKRGYTDGEEKWLARDTDDLSADLSTHFGLPIDFASKAAGLGAVARALNKGDVACAQLVALFLRMPACPAAAGETPSLESCRTFVVELAASGLLAKVWEPEKHPRWPAGALDGRGGEFAPKDGSGAQTILIADRVAQAPSYSTDAKRAPSKKPSREKSWEEVAAETPVHIVWGILPPPPGPIGFEIGEEEFLALYGPRIGLRPGAFGEESVPASGPRVTSQEQAEINRIGSQRGCHTCGANAPGTRSGNWIGDHQDPTAMNAEGNPQRLYPHCQTCSLRQGGWVSWFLRHFR